jgi:SanA protein
LYFFSCIGLHARGYNAREVSAYNGFLTKMRKKFAHVKVFVDIFTNKNPKFLGEKNMIE